LGLVRDAPSVAAFYMQTEQQDGNRLDEIYKYSQYSLAALPDRPSHTSNPSMPPANNPHPNQVRTCSNVQSEFFTRVSRRSNVLTHLTEEAVTQRRGPKGYFKGSRKEFLEGYLPEYLAHKKGGRQSFWHGLFSAWWRRFPWGLDDDREPPTDNPERMARLASVGPGDWAKKATVEKKLTDVWPCNLSSVVDQR